MADNEIIYTAEPTPAKFHASDAFVRALMGPIGSGKSVACCNEIIARCLRQTVHNGKRLSRWAVIRNTYPELKSTTIKTWEEWAPTSVCKINWGTPITGRLNFRMGDGTEVDAEIIFLALDRPQDIKKLKSLELTGGWINEACEISKSVLDMLTGRIGRYPPKRWGGSTWTGIIMDTNPPDDDSWFYKLFEKNRPESYEIYKQPPALIERGGEFFPNPEAENIRNHDLGYEYYLRQVPGKDPDWIKVFLMGQYGSVEDGRPVFPEFNDVVHVAGDEIVPIKGLPILAGMDFGLDPCAVLAQLTPRGQLLIFDELVSHGMGVRQFIQTILKPHLENHYAEYLIQIYGDPAGAQRAQSNERTCFQELKEAGLDAKPAGSDNAFTARREAVAGFLNRLVDGKPGFLLDTRCDSLRKALRGRYRYERVQATGDERYKSQPTKNRYSHIADALQYLCLAIDRGRKKTGKKRPGRGRKYTKPASSVAGY